MSDEGLIVASVEVKDIRFPAAEDAHGSDAMHTDPDYSCAYVVIGTKNGSKGFGLTFTLGRGTEIVVQAVRTLSHFILNRNANAIFADFGRTWREITSDSQLRWVGPEKGVIHLATCAIINALWDLWARLEDKPLWKLLCDMDPQTLVSTIDFRYITDVITAEECVKILYESEKFKEERVNKLAERGYPAYTTQVGWLGYSKTHVEDLCKSYLAQGFSAFKIKVGRNVADDIDRCRLVREVIGSQSILMLDANQKWDVDEAVDWMKKLEEFRPYWIEEPTSPDDVLGHLQISKHMNAMGIKVASGEMCANRVLFKQFLQARAIQVCQIDAARIGGINEILAVYFMAKKLNVPVCPHAGGVGLSGMVRHLQFFDYVRLSGTTDGRMIEYVDKYHEHFEDPVVMNSGRYILTQVPGYSTKFKDEVFEMFEFPFGKAWKTSESEKIPPNDAVNIK